MFFRKLVFSFLFLSLFIGEAFASEIEISISEVEDFAREKIEESGAGNEFRFISTRAIPYGRSDVYTLKKFSEKMDKQIFTVSEFNLNEDAKSFVVILKAAKTSPLVPTGELKISGRFEEVVEVPTLVRRMYRGEVVKESDVGFSKVVERKLRSTSVMDKSELVGKELTRMVATGKLINERDVVVPSAVDKGDLVSVIYRTKNMELKTTGQVLEDGAVGDVIKVKNLKSGSILQAMVKNSGDLIVNYSSIENAG